MAGSIRRKFSEEEKQAILEAAGLRGINVVLRENRLSYSVFSRWRSQFQPESVARQHDPRKMKQQLKELTIENELLRRIIANQALALQKTMEARVSNT